MDSSAFVKKNGKYFLKYSKAESYYKNGLLLECLLHYSKLMKGKLLDLGCGNKPYSDIYNQVCDSSMGCDVPFSLHHEADVEVICHAEEIDRHFSPEYFDCVLCTEVLEHTADDTKVIRNIHKVLKKNGHLILSAPFIYVLHEAPHDHRRYTLFGMKKILEENNFEMIGIHSLGATFSSGFFIFYYSLLKIFYYSFKKIGIKDLHEVTLVRAILNLPELIFYKLNISSFRNKLNKNKQPTANEMFSSPGYFVAAKKIED